MSDQPAKLDAESGRPDEQAVFEAPALLRILWADPQNMPEHLALWSLKRFGPRSSAAVEKLRTKHPNADRTELERIVIERQTRISTTEGALVGGPFIVLIPVAFCAALLAQGQMALELATLAGYAPDDEMRAADLLVLQGAYASTADASAALAKVARGPSSREGKRLPRGTRWNMIKRMAFLLGVLVPGEDTRSRLRSAFDKALVAAVLLVGFVLPFVWIPYLGYAFRKSALRMGERSTQFYAEGSADAGVTVRRAHRAQAGMSLGLLRMAALIVVPVAVALVALLTDTEIGGGKWVSAWIVLLAASVLTTLAGFAYLTWSRRRER